MYFYFTKKLMRAFKKAEKSAGESIADMQFLDESASSKTKDLFKWHGNSTTIGHDQYIVMTHDLSGLTLIFLNVHDEEMLEFTDYFEEALTDLLMRFGFSQKSVYRYINALDTYKATTSKATDSRKLGYNSAAITIAKQHNEWLEEDFVVQGYWAYQVTIKNRRAGADESPIETFIREFERNLGKVTYSASMAEIEVRLKMDYTKDVVRVIHMPLYLTFDDLHDVIQTVFLWEHAHFHQFILEDGTKIISAKQKFTMDAFYLESDNGSYAGSSVQLSDALTGDENRAFTYIYDFGDFWEHRILVRKFWTEHNRVKPKLTLMMGDPVPENVGGASGYYHFKEVLSDPAHEEHATVKEWATSYMNKLFVFNTVQRINNELALHYS